MWWTLLSRTTATTEDSAMGFLVLESAGEPAVVFGGDCAFCGTGFADCMADGIGRDGCCRRCPRSAQVHGVTTVREPPRLPPRPEPAR